MAFGDATKREVASNHAQDHGQVQGRHHLHREARRQRPCLHRRKGRSPLMPKAFPVVDIAVDRSRHNLCATARPCHRRFAASKKAACCMLLTCTWRNRVGPAARRRRSRCARADNFAPSPKSRPRRRRFVVIVLDRPARKTHRETALRGTHPLIVTATFRRHFRVLWPACTCYGRAALRKCAPARRFAAQCQISPARRQQPEHPERLARWA